MSNRNQYTNWRGASSGNQDQYYQGYQEDDSGNYYGYDAGPSAPRGGAEDVAGLSGGFAGMNMQDSPQHGQESYSQYAYSGSRYGTNSGEYNQDQYGASPPPAQPSSAAGKGKSSSKSKQKSHREDTKGKGSKKLSTRKPGQHSVYGPEHPEPADPFYQSDPRSRLAETSYDDGGKQDTYQQEEDSSSRPGKGRDWGGHVESDSYAGGDYPDAQPGQSYHQGDYAQADASREDYSDTPQSHQQGDYSQDDPSQADYPDPASGKGHKQRGKQRAQYQDEGYSEPQARGDDLTAESGSSHHYPASQEDPSYYAREDQGYSYGHEQEPVNYARSHRSKDAKSSSGKRSKDKSRRHHSPSSRVVTEDPAEQEGPEIEAILDAADGYLAGMSDYRPEPSSTQSHYYAQEEDDSGQQTPRQATPSVAGQSATIPPPMQPGVFDPYAPPYPQTSHDPGVYMNPDPSFDPTYDPNNYPDYQSQAGPSNSYGQPNAIEDSNYFDNIADDGTGGQEKLDSRYVVEPSSRFSAGEVFKVLWSEPRGSGQADLLTDKVEQSRMGEPFYVGVRRFIVIANDEGHCTCVPILTYERRACTKRGVKPNKHGIIYAVGGRASLVKNEPPLGFRPVRVQLDLATEKLAAESRVNYSKLVTVEHNVKVFFIGSIVREDFRIVNDAVDKCWYDKNRRVGANRDHPRDHDRRRDRQDRHDRRDRR